MPICFCLQLKLCVFGSGGGTPFSAPLTGNQRKAASANLRLYRYVFFRTAQAARETFLSFFIVVRRKVAGAQKQKKRDKIPLQTPLLRQNQSIRTYAFSTKPALRAFTLTQARFTAPVSVRTLMRWTFGLKVRFVCLTSCKPIPPLFLL